MSETYVSTNLTKVYKCMKLVNFKFSNHKLILNEDEYERIQDYWRNVLTNNNSLFNGRVLTVQKIDFGEERMTIDVGVTDYAHYTYIMNHEKEKITMCKAVAAGALLVTKDDYIFLGKMDAKTSFPGIIQCIGGGISEKDLTGEEATINTVIRECYEEIGIRIERDEVNSAEKYIYVRDKMSTLGFCYIVCSNLCKEEVKEIFRKHIGNSNEIEKLVYVKKDNEEIVKFCKENKLIDYLTPVLYDYLNICELSQIESNHLQ